MTFLPPADPLRVIVVDDQTDNALTLQFLLKMQGIETTTAKNGDETVAIMDEFKPDCVLFDICMPGMDGLALAKHLRATRGDDVILLAMTGLDADNMRVADTFHIVDHYFKKPFEFDALMRVLQPKRNPNGNSNVDFA